MSAFITNKMELETMLVVVGQKYKLICKINNC